MYVNIAAVTRVNLVIIHLNFLNLSPLCHDYLLGVTKPYNKAHLLQPSFAILKSDSDLILKL